MIPKLYVHCPYIGPTGYNRHAQDFFKHLSKYVDLKIRNYSVGRSWEGYNDEPHNGEDYLTELDKKLLYEQTLLHEDFTSKDHKIYTQHPNEFDHNLNLVLGDTNHPYFYNVYKGPKIAYNVWESTLQPDGFFTQLKHFDQVWVPSQWQAEHTIAQGISADKVKVVPEGVDTTIFYPEDPQTTLDYVDGRFKFVLFGRWEYRKSTKEIIETFLKEFKPDEPVDLILSADNQFANDGFNSTEERLEHYGFTDKRIKVKHFPSREDYITYMKNGHVFLSCARSEGWNLPLIEAMACGTPAIYSNCSGQLEFAKNRGLPVRIKGEVKNPNDIGNYYEPDFEDLAYVMRDAFVNYTDYKKRAIEQAKFIHRDFNWDKVAKIGKNTLQEFLKTYNPELKSNITDINYLNGPRVEITGDKEEEYLVEFIDSRDNKVIYSDIIRNNMWTKCSKKYYIPWIIKINGEEISRLNLENQRVLISLDSKSIGDTIGWTPYAVEFAKKHNCKVVLSTFHNDWFEGLEAYKNIEFTPPGTSTECYVHYKIGWFRDENGGWKDFDLHPRQCNTIPMQATATDILGLDYKELNYSLNFKKGDRPYKQKYIVIGPNATAGCKEWRYEYWVVLAKLLNQQGYIVVSLTQNEYKIDGVINHYGHPIENITNYLYHADLFIGLGSGLSWLNWALGKHTAMINGFAEPGHEFTKKLTRIFKENVCFPCWTNPNFAFDAGDWNWCPIWKGTDKQHICQKSITPQLVISKIKPLLKK